LPRDVTWERRLLEQLHDGVVVIVI